MWWRKTLSLDAMDRYLADRQRTRDRTSKSKAFFLVSKTDFFSSTPSHYVCAHCTLNTQPYSKRARLLIPFVQCFRFVVFFSSFIRLYRIFSLSSTKSSYILNGKKIVGAFFPHNAYTRTHTHTQKYNDTQSIKRAERQKCASSIFFSL